MRIAALGKHRTVAEELAVPAKKATEGWAVRDDTRKPRGSASASEGCARSPV
jgi:hypothetical protein